MRHNLLLHFLNRHAREIVGLPDDAKLCSHTGAFLTRAFLTSVLLSETAAIMPPGFFLESDIGFEIVSQYPEFIDNGVVELPMRELRLGDMIEKKRIEYAPARKEFAGLYDDKRLKFFDELTPRYVDRTTEIGVTATERWLAGPDVDDNWKDILATLSPEAIEVVRLGPRRLRDNGAALTWPALTAYLNSESLHHQGPVRLALQQNYFELYVREYSLGMLHQLPHKFDAFIPQNTIRYYPYQTFLRLLEILGLFSILDLSALKIIHLRLQPGWSRFVDAFVQLASEPDRPSQNVMNVFHSAFNTPTVKKMAAALRFHACDNEMEMIAELMGELGYMADDVSRRFNLKVRANQRSSEASGEETFQVHHNRDVVTAFDNLQRVRRMKNVFIITSNENENRAVLHELQAVAEGGKLVSDVSIASGYSKVSAMVQTKSGSANIDVAIARETGGAIAANLLRRRVQSGLFPDAIFVIGCAGLLWEKFRPDAGTAVALPEGLVIVAKKAWDGDARLVEDTGVTSRGDSFHGDRRLIESLRTLNGLNTFDADGITLITNREFLTTAAFLASENSEERKRLVGQFVSDAIVVENEAFPIYDEIQNLQSETGRIFPCLVVKGISDLGDEEARLNKVVKQKAATSNAAKVVLKLVREQ